MPSPKTALKTKTCRFCPHAFAKTEHLQRHERTHTKDRPFPCSECQKSFSRHDTLVRHLRGVHHSDKPVRPPKAAAKAAAAIAAAAAAANGGKTVSSISSISKGRGRRLSTASTTSAVSVDSAFFTERRSSIGEHFVLGSPASSTGSMAEDGITEEDELAFEHEGADGAAVDYDRISAFSPTTAAHEQQQPEFDFSSLHAQAAGMSASLPADWTNWFPQSSATLVANTSSAGSTDMNSSFSSASSPSAGAPAGVSLPNPPFFSAVHIPALLNSFGQHAHAHSADHANAYGSLNNPFAAISSMNHAGGDPAVHMVSPTRAHVPQYYAFGFSAQHSAGANHNPHARGGGAPGDEMIDPALRQIDVSDLDFGLSPQRPEDATTVGTSAAAGHPGIFIPATTSVAMSLSVGISVPAHSHSQWAATHAPSARRAHRDSISVATAALSLDASPSDRSALSMGSSVPSLVGGTGRGANVSSPGSSGSISSTASAAGRGAGPDWDDALSPISPSFPHDADLGSPLLCSDSPAAAAAAEGLATTTTGGGGAVSVADPTSLLLDFEASHNLRSFGLDEKLTAPDLSAVTFSPAASHQQHHHQTTNGGGADDGDAGRETAARKGATRKAYGTGAAATKDEDEDEGRMSTAMAEAFWKEFGPPGAVRLT